MKSRFLITVAALLIVGITLGACAPTAPKPKSYKIGLLDAMTGDSAVWGNSNLKGATIAVEEINAAGGVDGVPLELVVEDNRMSQPDTLTGFKKLAEVDKVPVVVGVSASSICFAVCPETEKYKTVLITPNATNPGLGPKCPDWFFRVMSSDAAQGPAMVRMLEYLGTTDVPVLWINNDYGIGVKDALIGEMDKLGYKVTRLQAFEWNATDFRTEIMKIAELKPKVTVLIGYPKEQGLILKQAKELGFETQWVADTCVVTKEVCEIAGAGAEGVMGVYAGGRLTPEYKTFAATFQKRYNELPTIWSEFAYDAIKLVAAAIKKGGYTSQGIKDSLRAVAENYVGPSGPKAFLPGDNVVGSYYEWDIAKNGEWVTFEH